MKKYESILIIDNSSNYRPAILKDIRPSIRDLFRNTGIQPCSWPTAIDPGSLPNSGD